jgi:hypothetical protein
MAAMILPSPVVIFDGSKKTPFHCGKNHTIAAIPMSIPPHILAIIHVLTKQQNGRHFCRPPKNQTGTTGFPSTAAQRSKHPLM